MTNMKIAGASWNYNHERIPVIVLRFSRWYTERKKMIAVLFWRARRVVESVKLFVGKFVGHLITNENKWIDR